MIQISNFPGGAAFQADQLDVNNSTGIAIEVIGDPTSVGKPAMISLNIISGTPTGVVLERSSGYSGYTTWRSGTDWNTSTDEIQEIFPSTGGATATGTPSLVFLIKHLPPKLRLKVSSGGAMSVRADIASLGAVDIR